jgi:hypothetical protein
MAKKSTKATKEESFIACTIKQLPKRLHLRAAAAAVEENPANRPNLEGHPLQAVLTPDHLALLTSKYFGPGGAKLTVGFLDNAPADLQNRILAHMNSWGQFCNATFVLSKTSPQVRIARAADGYWSYLGTDVLQIPQNEATMNLQGFTMNTPESEYKRVVRHETGHTLGFPHEHMRRELVNRIDRDKAIAYFARYDGWDATTVQQQVLTPLEDSSILGTEHADQDSIMCYQLPGSITKDGQPIRGGVDIDVSDQQFAAKVYPPVATPPEPPKPPPPGSKFPTVDQWNAECEFILKQHQGRPTTRQWIKQVQNWGAANLSK